MPTLDTIDARVEERVLYATLNTPPLNMIGPTLVRDLITLVLYLESHSDDVRVVVFDSASPDFFSAHVEMTQVSALRPELARLEPDAKLGTLFRRISQLEQVSIAAIGGRVRGGWQRICPGLRHAFRRSRCTIWSARSRGGSDPRGRRRTASHPTDGTWTRVGNQRATRSGTRCRP
jgi:hypothetical protein